MNPRWFVSFVTVALLSGDCTFADVQCKNEPAPDFQKIIGGTPVPCNRYPYVASFRIPSSGNHACAGALIDPWYILTSATCLDKAGKGRLEIYLGGFGIDDAIEKRQGTPIPHRKFREGAPLAGNDIGLVKLEEASGLQHPKLPRAAVPQGTSTTTIGWGRPVQRGAFACVLNHRVGMPVLGKAQCPKKARISKKSKRSTVLCIGPEFSPCRGDEGGPLLTTGDGTPENDVVVGVALNPSPFGVECGDRVPALFTDVRRHIRWIKKKLKE